MRKEAQREREREIGGEEWLKGEEAENIPEENF